MQYILKYKNKLISLLIKMESNMAAEKSAYSRLNFGWARSKLKQSGENVIYKGFDIPTCLSKY